MKINKKIALNNSKIYTTIEINKKNDNLTLLENHLSDLIEIESKKGKIKLKYSIPYNPKEDEGTNQFLIANPKSKLTFGKNGFADKKIVEILELNDFKVKAEEVRDSMSGVKFLKLEIDWRE